MTEYDYVATGNVSQGEYERRYEAEAEEIPYRELTYAEAEDIERQENEELQ
jgi:hypothetical protein